MSACLFLLISCGTPPLAIGAAVLLLLRGRRPLRSAGGGLPPFYLRYRLGTLCSATFALCAALATSRGMPGQGLLHWSATSLFWFAAYLPLVLLAKLVLDDLCSTRPRQTSERHNVLSCNCLRTR